MIGDRERTLSYRNAIKANVKKQNVVLDVGCGTGILSFFAIKAGCKKVYAVDNSRIINTAIESAKLNNLLDKIEFIKKDIRELKMNKIIDLLIHEQIGTYIWNEGLLEKIVYAREKLLKRGGKILPDIIDIYFVPVNHRSDYLKSIDFWSKKKYGIDFTNIRDRVLREREIEMGKPCKVFLNDTSTFLCKEKLVDSIDLNTATKVPRTISSYFEFKKDNYLTGMCCFFIVRLDKARRISTRPKKENTHWGQMFIPFPKERMVNKGDVLEFILYPHQECDKWKYAFKLSKDKGEN